MKPDEIYKTMKGYESEGQEVTTAMEDYLEMILRLTGNGNTGYVRVGELAEHLAVKPSSASKMAGHLRDKGFVNYEKYGLLTLTESGKEYAAYLIRRHELLNRLLCLINGTENELKQVERTEHFFDERTVDNIERFLEGKNNNEG